MATLDSVTNFAKANVSAGYASGVTSIDLEAGKGAKFPNPATDGAFNFVWWNTTDYGDPADDPNVEICRCTARSTDTLTIIRAQEGTADVNHNTDGKTYKIILALTAKMVTDINARGVSVQTVSGTIDGNNTAFTVPLAFVGKSVITLAGQIYVEDIDYTVSGANITFLYALSADKEAVDRTFILICII
jgi:hypothetical protein